MKFLFLFFTFMLHLHSFAQSNTKAVAPQDEFLLLKNYKFPYLSTHTLNEGSDQIQEAIIVVHGSLANSETYLNTMKIMADKLGVRNRTLVIAPRFYNLELMQEEKLPLPEKEILAWKIENECGWAEVLQSMLLLFRLLI